MARKCDLTNKGAMSGNNVSHSNRKTKRRFLPNIQSVSLISEALQRTISLKLSVKTLRSVDHNGGLDNYLVNTADKNLSAEAIKLKKKVKTALKDKAA